MPEPLSAARSEIKQQLTLLMMLQDLDTEIMDIEDDLDRMPTLIEEGENSLEKIKRKLTLNEERYHDLEEERENCVQAINLEKLKVKNIQNRESAANIDKPYNAYTEEETDDVRNLADLERILLEIFRRQDKLVSKKKSLKLEIEEKAKQILLSQVNMDEKKKELSQSLDKLYSMRDDMAEKLSESVYYKYEYIAERKEGIAVAKVELGHCIICNMAIPPQMYNELIRGDQLMTCPACHRILAHTEESQQ